MVVFFWWCGVVGVVLELCFLWWCGGVFVVTGGGGGVLVAVFWCGGVFVSVFLWCSCGGVFVMVFLYVFLVKGRLSSHYREGMQRVLTTLV